MPCFPCGFILQNGRGLVVVDRRDPVLLQPLQQRRNHFRNVRASWPGDDADSFERGFWPHGLPRFYPSRFSSAKEILLVSLGPRQTARRNAEHTQSKRFHRAPHGGNGFFVQCPLTHDSSFAHILSFQFKLWLDQDQEVSSRLCTRGRPCQGSTH